ncbi:MAG: DivIVA domain-containing protein [Halanaerobium sp.]
MKLTPLDIYNKEFSKSTFGYNTNQVDEFMDDIGVAYERLLKDLNKLQEENDLLKDKLDEYNDMEARLQQTLNSMQDNISDRIEQADKEASIIVREARMKAEQIKENAKEQVVEEKRKVEQLREQKNFFKIRFQTLLESHLEMLKDEDDQSSESRDFEVEFENDLDNQAETDFSREVKAKEDNQEEKKKENTDFDISDFRYESYRKSDEI